MLYHKKPNLNTTCTNEGHEIPCVRLDTYCMNHSPPDAIKMDIEGAEVAAIYGAWETIKKHFPKLFIELHPDKYSSQNNFAYVLERLVDLGYNFKYVENAKDKLDYFKSSTCVKAFSFYKKRKVFADIPTDDVIEWCTKIDKDGKKIIRSIMMEKP